MAREAGRALAQAAAAQPCPELQATPRSRCFAANLKAYPSNLPLLLQFLGMLGTTGGLQELVAAAQPLYLADHVAAIASWIGFYVAEAVAVAAVLKAYAGDQTAAVRMHCFAQGSAALGTCSTAGSEGAASSYRVCLVQ